MKKSKVWLECLKAAAAASSKHPMYFSGVPTETIAKEADSYMKEYEKRFVFDEKDNDSA